MSKWFGRILIVLGVLMIVGATGYYWLFIETHIPSGEYAIDMAEVRRLAQSLPGDKPQEIRVEHVATFQFPGIGVVAGDPWDPVDLPVFSYQLVWPDHTAIVDTALDEQTAKQVGTTSFDAAAYGRMMTAMNASSLILITHEHMDHIGGLITAPNLADLLKITRLNKEQLEHDERIVPLKWPEGARQGYQPVDYEKYLAIAPGVVLIRSPGHTPGSQLVYVQRADGTEVLFLGDVAWHERNIDLQRQRARLMTWYFLREDRDQVMLELKEFKRLHEAEPALRLVPGHDGEAAALLVKDGIFVEGFK